MGSPWVAVPRLFSMTMVTVAFLQSPFQMQSSKCLLFSSKGPLDGDATHDGTLRSAVDVVNMTLLLLPLLVVVVVVVGVNAHIVAWRFVHRYASCELRPSPYPVLV